MASVAAGQHDVNAEFAAQRPAPDFAEAETQGDEVQPTSPGGSYPSKMRSQVLEARRADPAPPNVPRRGPESPAAKIFANRHASQLAEINNRTQQTDAQEAVADVSLAATEQDARDAAFTVKISCPDGGERNVELSMARSASNLGAHCALRAVSTAPSCLNHGEEVKALAFSPDGRSLLAGGEDSHLVLWDVASQSKLFEIQMQGAVLAVAYSGSFFACGDSASFVTLWASDDRSQHAQLQIDGTILCMAIVQRPRPLLAVGMSEQKCLLLSIPALEEVAIMETADPVRSLSFSPSGGLLAGGGGGSEGRDGFGIRRPDAAQVQTVIWQVPSENHGCTCVDSMTFDGIVHAVLFSPDGAFLAVAGEYRAVAVLQVDAAFELTCELPISAGVRCIAWSANSLFLATAGEDMQVTVWNVDERKVAFQLPKVCDWLCAVAFSPSNQWLAACGYGGDYVSLYALEAVEDGYASRALTPIQEDSLAVRRENSCIRSLAIGVKRQPMTMALSSERDKVRLPHSDEVKSIAFSPDGSYLLAGGEDKHVVLWAVDTGERVATKIMSSPVVLVHYFPSGEYIAAADTDSFVAVGRANSDLDEVAEVAVEGQVLSLASASLGAGLLAVGTSAKKVNLLSLPSLIEAMTINFESDVRSLSFSPDGRMLAGGGGGSTTDLQELVGGHKAIVWHVSETGYHLTPIKEVACSGVVRVVEFAPSGKLLAVAGENRCVTTHLVERDFEQVDELPCAACVQTIAWSCDSRFLSTAGEDMQITVWDLLEAKVLFKLSKAADWYCQVAFSPCRSWLASCQFSDAAVSLQPLDMVALSTSPRSPYSKTVKDQYADARSLEMQAEQHEDPAGVKVIAVPVHPYWETDTQSGDTNCVAHASAHGFVISVEPAGV